MRDSNINDRTGFAIVSLLAIFPIPFASNRPFFWALWTCLICLIAAIYIFVITIRSQNLRVKMSSIGLVTGLWVVFCLYSLFQTLPIGKLLGPFEFLAASGEIFKSDYPSLSPGASFLTFLQATAYGIFLFLALQVTANPRRRTQMLRGALYIVSIHALYGLFALKQFGDTILFFQKWAYEGSATGTFVNRNSFATFLAFGLVIGVCLLISEIPVSKRARAEEPFLQRVQPFQLASYSICVIVLVSTLIATRSRMGLFAALSGALLSALLAYSKRRDLGFHRTLGFALFAAGVLVLFPLYDTGLLERLRSTTESALGRAALYEQIWQMILANRWRGYGGGTFEIAFPLFHQPPVPTENIWDKAHSSYLTLWSEYGLIAGSLPLLTFGLFAKRAWRAFRLVQSHWVAPPIAMGVITVAAVHSLVDFSLEIQANAFLFLFLVAAGSHVDTGPSKPGDLQ